MANIALGKHFKDFVKTQVKNGNFRDASEVVQVSLQLLEASLHTRRASDAPIPDFYYELTEGFKRITPHREGQGRKRGDPS